MKPKQPAAESTLTDRRNFLLKSAGLSAAGCVALSATPATAKSLEGSRSLIEPGDTVLFQGDSITDAGRKRTLTEQPNHQGAMGNGYAWMAASQILAAGTKDNLKIYNRGISGDKVVQLADRWQEDCLELKPNVLSVLVGVNDIWHKLKGIYDGTPEKYERDYRTLLDRTLNALPEIKLIVCEPFVLRCGTVDDKWFPAFDVYREAAHRIAKATGAVLVPFQAMFDRAVEFAPPQHWAGDGVHPTPFGNALMAHTWLGAVDG